MQGSFYFTLILCTGTGTGTGTATGLACEQTNLEQFFALLFWSEYGRRARKAQKYIAKSSFLFLVSLFLSLPLFACALQYEHRVQLISLSRAVSRSLTVQGICQFTVYYGFASSSSASARATHTPTLFISLVVTLSRSSCLLSKRSNEPTLFISLFSLPMVILLSIHSSLLQIDSNSLVLALAFLDHQENTAITCLYAKLMQQK